VREFVEMCARQPLTGVKRPRYDETEQFLDRCCEIGFLERKNEARFGVRYDPTEALVEWASWFGGR
jgi:hypothetical protein